MFLRLDEKSLDRQAGSEPAVNKTGEFCLPITCADWMRALLPGPNFCRFRREIIGDLSAHVAPMNVWHEPGLKPF